MEKKSEEQMIAKEGKGVDVNEVLSLLLVLSGDFPERWAMSWPARSGQGSSLGTELIEEESKQSRKIAMIIPNAT